MTRVLAADVGGTKTDLSLFEGPDVTALSLTREERFESQAFSGLLPMLGEFLHGERVDAAGFGVAGPVSKGVVHTTNLPWIVKASDLAAVCGTEHVTLINDVQAAALGVRAVPAERHVWLQAVEPDPRGLVALISVGTGFGCSFVAPPSRAYPSEAGHASFAARNVIERHLVDFLSERHDNIAVEHVLSGPGLKALYEFVVGEGLAPATSQLEIERAEDPVAQIGYLGVRDLDQACAAAVALFVDVLGAELGNIALQVLPRGGLYLWGGVARRLRPVIEKGDLLDSFRDKNRMAGLLETFPLALIDDPGLGILGARVAATCALTESRGLP